MGAPDASTRLPSEAVNPLLIGPKLVLRALDDLHAIAEAARDLPTRIDALEDRLEHIEVQASTAIDVARDINQTAATAMAVAEQVDVRLLAVLALGERIEVRAQQVAEVGTQVVAALPTLERAVLMATPLEGAVERVGRLVDRLPGGRLPPEHK
jgi:DNA repair ATPase RecN